MRKDLPVTPEGFKKYIPMFNWKVVDQHFYSLPYIAQYANASVIGLHVDSDEPGKPIDRGKYLFLDLGENYKTWKTFGMGNRTHYAYRFTVYPPLPEDLSGIILTFQEYYDDDSVTDFEIVWNLN